MKKDIDAEFSNLIREELSEKEFWDYVSSWKDADALCEEMENWDIETKRYAIKELKEIIKNRK
jgi:hypothetical protein